MLGWFSSDVISTQMRSNAFGEERIGRTEPFPFVIRTVLYE